MQHKAKSKSKLIINGKYHLEFLPSNFQNSYISYFGCKCWDDSPSLLLCPKKRYGFF